MQDIALYRKYRPGNFDEVLGQDHIVKVLKGSISLGNISHSYLFFGSRGTGKTSVARIVASELGVSTEDTFEIDAASNRGIDDIRSLRDGVNTLPFNSKYKIYIIDEVHMLTKEAWNALLKTLEEPPKHVIFILATTEIDKVPDTIVSRCQVFTFKKPNISVLKEMISGVLKKEKFKIDEAGIELISLLGDGSFRDTYGVLQKVMSFSKDQKIDLKEIETVTGAPNGKLVNDLLEAVVKSDGDGGVETIKKLEEGNIDVEVFLKIFLARLRTALLLRYAPNMKKELLETISEDDSKVLVELLKEKGTGISSKTLEIFLETQINIKYATSKTLALELAFVKTLEN